MFWSLPFNDIFRLFNSLNCRRAFNEFLLFKECLVFLSDQGSQFLSFQKQIWICDWPSIDHFKNLTSHILIYSSDTLNFSSLSFFSSFSLKSLRFLSLFSFLFIFFLNDCILYMRLNISLQKVIAFRFLISKSFLFVNKNCSFTSKSFLILRCCRSL